MMSCENHQMCMDYAFKKVEEMCVLKNVNLTSLRKKILNIVLASHEPIKAYDILAQLQLTSKSAKPITVYRILDLFLANDMVHKLTSNNSYFCCSNPGTPHHHFVLICKKCHSAEESSVSHIDNIIGDVAQKQNFKVKNISIEIQGICKHCHI